MKRYVEATLIISIHALREEGDGRGLRQYMGYPQYFYPRPPRGGRLQHRGDVHTTVNISIHALREEGDGDPLARLCLIQKISIHALREEGDSPLQDNQGSACIFLSTPSARRATHVQLIAVTRVGVFLSTPSARRATMPSLSAVSSSMDFYPRPPRGGRLVACSAPELILHFYPRPPRGGRRALCATLPSGMVFLSTPSARRATTTSCRSCPAAGYFYPRPPRGGRPTARARQTSTRCISIHALREEGDLHG